MSIDIISRNEWAASNPKKSPRLFRQPPILIHFTSTGTEECHNFLQCADILQRLQDKQIEEGLPDIAYNFLVSNGGQIYEGRGWDKIPSLIPNYVLTKSKCFVIAFIGEFVDSPPSTEMLAGVSTLLTDGLSRRKIDRKFQRLKFIPAKNEHAVKHEIV